jgi:iron(III) transport system permease protein
MSRLWTYLTIENLVAIVTAATLAWLVLYPLALLLIGSLRTALPMQEGAYTLDNFKDIFTSSANRRALGNTVVTSTLTTGLALVIGTSLAWITSRTDTPGRSFFDNALVIPFFLSPFIGAIAWTLLANERIGIINTFFVKVLGFPSAPFNIYSLGGLVFVMALYFTPIVFLFVSGALRSMDPALEEASRMLGVNTLGTTLRVTLPLAAPAITSSALLVFVASAGQFGIPATIGIPMDYHVITTRIWIALGYYPPGYSEAAAFSMVLLIGSAVIIYLQRRFVARKSFVTVTGKGFRPQLVALGPWKALAFAICLLYFLLSIVLPYGVLLYTSIQPYLNFTWTPSMWSLRHYGELFLDNPTVLRAIRNSLILAGGGATLAILFAFFISYIVMRTRSRTRGAVDYLSTFPVAIPSVVLAVGILWGYLFLPIHVYGTLWLLLIAYVTHYIPYGVRATSSSLAQISPELEECSRVHGRDWFRTVWAISLPLLKQGLMVGWTLLFIEFLRSLSLSILLYSSKSIVIPVVIYELYETGAYPALAALSVFQTALILLAVVLAKRLAGVNSFLDLK